MAVLDKQRSSAELMQPPSSEHFLKMIECFCCKKLTNPKSYLVCQEKGHMICESCAIKESNARSRNDCHLAGTCCALDKLQRGSPQMLNSLLSIWIWACDNEEKGCRAIFLGKEWASHMRTCSFNGSWRCRYFDSHSCPNVFPCMMDLMKHYIKDHGAVIFKPLGKKTFHLPPIKLDSSPKQRHLAILQFKGCLFIFACELRRTFLHMWLWSLDMRNPLLEKLSEVEYSIQIQTHSNPGDPNDGDGGHFPDFKGIAMPYKNYRPKYIAKKRVRFENGPPQIERHFTISEEKFRNLFVEGEKEPKIVVTLKESEVLPLEIRITQREWLNEPNSHGRRKGVLLNW